MKAESDILCTSRNAVQVVNSIPADQPILFLPDINLGNYVRKQTGRENMKIWQGTCIVHATFAARKLAAARVEHPSALVAAHPECPKDVLAMADFIGSTSAIIDWCTHQDAPEFIGDPGTALSGIVLKNVQQIVDSGFLIGADYGLQPTTQTWSVRTDRNTQSGTYNYWCAVHDFMHGVLLIGQ